MRVAEHFPPRTKFVWSMVLFRSFTSHALAETVNPITAIAAKRAIPASVHRSFLSDLRKVFSFRMFGVNVLLKLLRAPFSAGVIELAFERHRLYLTLGIHVDSTGWALKKCRLHTFLLSFGGARVLLRFVGASGATPRHASCHICETICASHNVAFCASYHLLMCE